MTSAADEYVALAAAIHSACAAGPWLDVELTLPQLKVLFLLESEQELGVGELAERLGVGISALSHLADRLEQLGLVERRADPADRRRVFLEPTAHVRQMLARLRAGRREDLARWLDAMAPEDVDALLRGMRALARAAGSYHGAFAARP